jgi:hypothetical protein
MNDLRPKLIKVMITAILYLFFVFLTETSTVAVYSFECNESFGRDYVLC